MTPETMEQIGNGLQKQVNELKTHDRKSMDTMKKKPSQLPRDHQTFLMEIWISGHVPQCSDKSQPVKWDASGIVKGTKTRYDDPIVKELEDWGYIDIDQLGKTILITQEATRHEKELMMAYKDFTRQKPSD